MCDAPQVNHRSRSDLNASCIQLVDEAQRSGDAELARACDVIAKYLRQRRSAEAGEKLLGAAAELIAPIKDFLALPPEERVRELEPFCEDLAARIGAAEAELD